MKNIPFIGPMTEVQSNNIIEWIASLRSGKWRQGTKCLHSNGCFCCLGVASKIHNIPMIDDVSFQYPIGISRTLIPEYCWFLETFGFDRLYDIVITDANQKISLPVLNDIPKSFYIIANVIEATFIERRQIEF